MVMFFGVMLVSIWPECDKIGKRVLGGWDCSWGIRLSAGVYGRGVRNQAGTC